MAGCDPSGYGAVLGFGDQRNIAGGGNLYDLAKNFRSPSCA
jgi:hypothetical protein